MIDANRREMFKELYRLAEYYERPPFQPGKFAENAEWFEIAMKEQMAPFLMKYPYQLATDLAMAILDDADRQAKAANNS